MSYSSSDACVREAVQSDLDTLVQIEQSCFASDRLSKRSFLRHIQSEHSDLVVVEQDDPGKSGPCAYGLSFRHRGTRLARLYSLAVKPDSRGKGVARQIINELETRAYGHGRLFMRLEVAKNNRSAIGLYEANGYRVFGEYDDYYQDHSDALRMQKTIRHIPVTSISRQIPWYQQTTDFTCGPAALMMAMASLKPECRYDQMHELDIWREATTVFMTSGHGGSHPFGLALAASRRGFEARVWVNNESPLFIEGVRSESKKQVMTTVHHQFLQLCFDRAVQINYQDISQADVEEAIKQGYVVLVLISTYRLDGKKTPHWVVVTGFDDICLFVHDPDRDENTQQPIDCQYIPVARDDFEKMSAFGAQRLRTAVAIKAKS